MTFAYVRVSTEKQSLENQRFALEEFAKKNGLVIEKWVSETVSGLKETKERKLGGLFKNAKKGDTIVISEISRLGRNIFMIIEALGYCVARGFRIISAKEGYHLGDDLVSMVLAFAFSIAAQIERDLITQRTKEALARRKAEGKHLGRKHGFKPAMRRLEERREEVFAALEGGVSQNEAAKRFGVGRNTLRGFAKENSNPHTSCIAPAGRG